jgi:hypothetical protein
MLVSHKSLLKPTLKCAGQAQPSWKVALFSFSRVKSERPVFDGRPQSTPIATSGGPGRYDQAFSKAKGGDEFGTVVQTGMGLNDNRKLANLAQKCGTP